MIASLVFICLLVKQRVCERALFCSSKIFNTHQQKQKKRTSICGNSIPTYGHSGYVTITGDKAASPSRNCFAFLERQSFLEFWRLHRKILLLSLAVTQQKATTQEDSLCVSVRQCSSGLSGGIRARDLTEKGPVSCACVCVCVFYSSESQWSRPSLIMSSQTSRHPNRIPCVDVG